MIDCDKLTTIFSFNVNISENCEMSKTHGWNLLEGKGKAAPGPSHACASAFARPVVSAAGSVWEDCLACQVCGTKVQGARAGLHVRDGSGMVPPEVGAAFLPFQKRYLLSLLCAVLTLAQVDPLG